MQPQYILLAMIKTLLDLWFPSSITKGSNVETESAESGKAGTRVEEFMSLVERAFRTPMEKGGLVSLSNGLRDQCLKRLEDPECMLPSFNHQLPSGEECGQFLALDVGGSTFRVALIELLGSKTGDQKIHILEMDSYRITRDVRSLKGVAFFDWMADQIGITLSGRMEDYQKNEAPLSMGLSWSFPIEQTSLRSGRLQKMGKGFLAAEGLLNEDLGDLIQFSCSKKGLNVQLNAIVNDGSATLLSKAYMDTTTRFGLILGTGVNAAVHLPVHVFAPPKFGTRPAEWHASAKHVIVNTELSMFGAGVLPLTKWDKTLNAVHPRPLFQPFEHFVSGGYLGEVARLVLVDAIEQAGLFRGIIPPSLRTGYSLETETLSRLASDQSATKTEAQKVFLETHPTSPPPSPRDIEALCLIASHVTHRATGVLASGVHALWQLRNDAEDIPAQNSSHTLVAYNGSVIENYPDFKNACQKHLDTLVEATGGRKGVIELMYAEESSLLGAAVAGAVACRG